VSPMSPMSPMSSMSSMRIPAAGLLLLSLASSLGCAGGPAARLPAAPANPEAAEAAGGTAGQGSTDQQVMVTYPPAPPAIWARNTAEIARDYRLGIVFSWTLSSLGEQCVVFQVVDKRPARELVHRLASDPRVGSAQLIATFATETAAAPPAGTDPYAHLQHGSQALRLDQAHRLATGKGVRVAVVDTGVDFDHPDLRGRVVKAQNFVDRVGDRNFTTDVHGTAVAGLIAATAGNGVGIVGVAPEAEIYALKACWQQPPGAREAVCNSYTLAKAVDFAIGQGVQVLNFSLAGPPDPLLGRLIGQALSRGIVVVAADGGGTPGKAADFPASYQGVLGILGSNDLQGELARPAAASAVAAAHGAGRPALAAPSVDILTTAPQGHYDLFSGSSLAAAEVSGIAALMLERNPKLTPPQLAAILHKTARPIAATAAAQVDACAAVASASGGGNCE
jgi:subtilisin family serine protease